MYLNVTLVRETVTRHKSYLRDQKKEVEHLGFWVCLESFFVDALADALGFLLTTWRLAHHISLPHPNPMT
ncbi:hypothetical protein NBG4_1260005 [Candidatus Sulfobium mesophilum]|uniref:Uncharacterized protein n=1 Tax=Candidatus Sulfobium mesophilum TaxID=2016548 RepID=A0A2U3QEU6_9BACT|nr:hypothetical protein NBG4_1260005 [Candidatus Sulfobium mesophilum]